MRSRWRDYYENSTAVVFAVLLHVALGAVLFFAVRNPAPPPAVSTPVPAPIDAVVVDQSQLQSELDRLAEAELRKKREEAERQAALRLAEERRRQEELRLAELKREQEEATRKAELAAQQARAEEQRQQAEQKKAEAARREAEEAQRKAEAAEAQRKAAEEARKKAEEEAQRKAEAEAKRKAEEEAQRKAEAEAKRKAEEEAHKKAEEDARRQLAESLRQAARAREVDDLVKRYSGLIKQQVERFWLLPPNSRRGLSCILKIELSEQGQVLNVQLVSSSGDALFDRSAVAAVQRASPLPLPDNPEARATFRSFNFKFEPEG